MEWDDLDTLGSEEERLLRSVTEEEDIYFDGNRIRCFLRSFV